MKIEMIRMHSSRMRTARAFTVCRNLLPRGCTCLVPGGTWSGRGTCLVLGGGCTCLVWGVYLPCPRGCTWSGGCTCLVLGGTCLVPGGGGVGVPAWSRGVYLVRYLPPPVDRMTHAYENITLPQTSFEGGNKTKDSHNPSFINTVRKKIERMSILLNPFGQGRWTTV